MIIPTLKGNAMAAWAIGLTVAYWVFGVLATYLPDGGPWWSAVVSAWTLITGILLATVAFPRSLSVIRRGVVGPGEIAVIGISLMVCGMIWTGLFSIIYYLAGRPDSWVGPVSSFGRGSASMGMLLLFLAPEATREGLRSPRPIVIMIALLLTAVVAFGLGLTFADSKIMQTSTFEWARKTIDYSLIFTRRA